MSYVDLYILFFLPIAFWSLVKGWAELTSTPFCPRLDLEVCHGQGWIFLFLAWPRLDFVSMLFGSYGGLAGSFSWFNLYILLWLLAFWIRNGLQKARCWHASKFPFLVLSILNPDRDSASGVLHWWIRSMHCVVLFSFLWNGFTKWGAWIVKCLNLEVAM
jgi:hypothetical protein